MDNKFINQNRNILIDNVKGVLIILVVFAHLLELTDIYNGRVNRYLYEVIYSFHMPLFIFISGYLAKPMTRQKLFKKIILPYIIFQILYTIFNYFLFGQDKIGFGRPYWILWYLMSLGFWNIIIRLFDDITKETSKNKIILLVIMAVVFGLVVGFSDNIGYYLSLSRTIVFFPYFLSGYCFKKKEIDIFKIITDNRRFIIPIAIFCVIAWGFGFKFIEINNFYCSVGYGGQFKRLFIRMILYISAIGLGAGVIAITKTGEGFISKVGRNSIYIFLFHGFVIKLLAYFL